MRSPLDRHSLRIGTLVMALLLSACAGSYEGTGSRGIARRPIRIVQESDNGDKSVNSAISAELAHRGFRVTSEANAPLKLGFSDEWTWDLAMYLRALNLRIVDATSGATVASAQYSASVWHDFPNPQSVVKALFEKWDKDGVFR